MTVSVIIPTYNGAHKILNALHSLEEQEHKPNEVIVVVDGSTDNTLSLLRNTKLNLSNFKIVEQENGGRAQVRNRGAAEAKGEYIIFLDDDMIASKGWVKAHVLHHTIYPNTLVTGRLEDVNEEALNDYHKFRFWQNHKWTSFSFEISKKGSSYLLKDVYITASNFSIQRQLFFELGGFDERLNDAEDYDLGVRANLRGFSIYLNHDALTFNDDVDNITCLKSIIRQRQYAKAHEQLRKMKPEIYNGVIARAAYKPDAFKSIVFRSLCSKWWVDSVDKGYWKWLPEQIRFKLYDLIITANGVLYPDKVKLT